MSSNRRKAAAALQETNETITANDAIPADSKQHSKKQRIQDQVAMLEKQVADQKATLTSLEKKAAEGDAKITSQANYIIALSTNNSEFKQYTDWATSTVLTMHTERTKAVHTISERDIALAAANRAISEKDAKLTKAHCAILEKNAALATANQTIAQMEYENKNLKIRLNAVLSFDTNSFLAPEINTSTTSRSNNNSALNPPTSANQTSVHQARAPLTISVDSPTASHTSSEPSSTHTTTSSSTFFATSPKAASPKASSSIGLLPPLVPPSP